MLYSILTLLLLAPFAMALNGNEKTVYDFEVKTIDGKSVSLSQYKGKKILIVNTASECGYTPQYADLEKLYEQKKDKLVILGFPSNDFGHQEPGSNTEIAQFCQKNYGVTFPMFEKVDVKGDDAAPLYQFLAKATGEHPNWNFCKYLIDENGKILGFFHSKVKPTDPEIAGKI